MQVDIDNTSDNKLDVRNITEKLILKIALISYNKPILILSILGLTLALFLFFVQKVNIDNSYESYFVSGDPSFNVYNSFIKSFGSDEFVYILYRPKHSNNLFSTETLESISTLAESLKDIPFASKVHALTNKEFIFSDENDLSFLKIDEMVESQALDYGQIQKYLLNKSYINGNLLTEDGKYGAIFVEMSKNFLDEEENTENYSSVVYKSIQEILSNPAYHALELVAVGDPLINHVYNTTSENESIKMTGFALLFVAILIFIFYRSFRLPIGVLLVVIFALLGSVALLGMLEWKITLLFVILPSLLLTLGISACIHLLSTHKLQLQRNINSITALKQAVLEIAFPTFMTTVTTIAGFLSLLVAPIRAIREFAIYSSTGILLSFLFTFLILPMFLKQKEQKKSTTDKKQISTVLLNHVFNISITHPKKILAIFSVVGVISIVGITKIQLESNWIEEFGDDIPIKHAYNKMNNIMGGTGTFALVLSGAKDSFYTTDFLERLEKFQSKAQSYTSITKTISLLDIVKDINVAFNNGDELYRRIPNNNDLISQYLLAYEIGGGEDLDDYVNFDRTKTQITIRIKMGNTNELLDIFDQLNIDAKILFAGYTPKMTGISSLSIKMVDYITQGQIQGFLLAFILISLFMFAIFRKIKYSIISMIPNLFPILFVLGIMGWFEIKLDYIKMLIACIAIGICVDDTIHFFTRFKIFFESKARNYVEALSNTIHSVGIPIIITSFILCVGFLIDTTSSMASMQSFGLLTMLTIFLALLSDLFLGSALLYLFKPLRADK